MTQNPSQSSNECRPARTRGWGWLRLGVALLLLGGVWLLLECDWIPAWGHVIESSTSLDIRLLGIRPDGGDRLYDAEGKEIGERIGYDRDLAWNAGQMRRDILIEIPRIAEPICWVQPAIVRASGADALWHDLVMFSAPTRIQDDKALLTLACELDWQYRDSIGIGSIRFPRQAQLSHVDVLLRYYQGDRGPADAEFQGPFALDSTCLDPNQPGYQLIFKRPGLTEEFEIKTNQRYDPATPALVYTKDGFVYLPNYGGGGFSNRSCRITYSLSGLPVSIADIKLITFNETSHETVLRNIPLQFDGLKPRAYAPHLDEVAARLGLSVQQNGRIRDFSIQDRDEAIAVMDVARSQRMIGRIVDCIASGRTDLATYDFDPEQRERMLQTAEIWVKASEPMVRAAGLRVGLSVNPKAFVDRALAMLKHEGSLDTGTNPAVIQTSVPRSSSEWRWGLAHTMHRARLQLSQEQMMGIADLLIERFDPFVYKPLVNCIRLSYQNPHALGALERLAEADQPWLWAAAIKEANATLRALRDSRGFSRKVQMRAAALGLEKTAWHPDLDISQQERLEILRPALTPQMLQLDISLFSHILEAVCDGTPPDDATPILVTFLRQLHQEWDTWRVPNRSSNNWWGVDRCVKYLNLWHDTDIGGLGQDVNTETRDNHSFDWRAIVLEALNWAETGTDPGKLPQGWRPESGDIRIVWKNLLRPELSVISIWCVQQMRTESRAWRPLILVHDFLNLRILGRLDLPGTCQVEMKVGVKDHHSMSQDSTLDMPLQGPRNLETKEYTGSVGRYSDGTEVRDRTWLGHWEVWLEPADARQSVLGETHLFAEWAKQYLNPKGIDMPLPVTFARHPKSVLREYVLSLRDYTDWTPAEIALRQAMDQDVNYQGWDIRPVSEPIRAQSAIAAWERFLERDDLTREMQISAWWRISQYYTSLAPHRDDRPDFRRAVPALVRALSIDPEYVCDATLYSASYLASVAGDGNRDLGFTAMERARMFADCVAWLHTRTDEMITQSVRRPQLFNFGNDLFPLRTLRNDSEDDLRRRQAGTRRQLDSVLNRIRAGLERRMQAFRREDPAAAEYLEERLQDIQTK